MGIIQDIGNAFTSPINVLLEGIKGAIGKIYEPTHLKKMAEAKSHEIEVMSKVLRENSDIPITYNNNGITMDSVDYNAFVKRAEGRLAYQELRKQENIEKVAGKAVILLEGEQEIPNTQLDTDWMIRFFNSVEDISNDDMQNLWARILAGEVKHPGSFSLRTLEVLRKMSKSEADNFINVCRHVIISDDQYYVDCETVQRQEGIIYDTVLSMDDCGIMNSNGLIQYSEKIKDQKKLIVRNNSVAIMARNKNEEEYLITFNAFPLTAAGYELANMIGVTTSDKEIYRIANDLAQKNPNIIITVDRVVFTEGKEISYEEMDA